MRLLRTFKCQNGLCASVSHKIVRVCHLQAYKADVGSVPIELLLSLLIEIQNYFYATFNTTSR